MLQARFAIEIYKQFQSQLPRGIRMRLKQYIDRQGEQWQEIALLETRLKNTPYRLILDMKHWHQRWTYIKSYYPEPHITSILDRHLQEESLFIDIGANIGVHTVYAAHKVGKSGQVIAFEPNPYSYQRLGDQIALNHLKNVTAHHTALGSEIGTIVLHGCNDENVGSSLRVDESGEGDCEVPLNLADNFLADIPDRQSGICKIDVEGYEYQVLQGLKGFIESHPGMVYIVEITDEWLKMGGSSAQTVFDFFEDYGFQAYHIEPQSARLEQLDCALSDWQYDVLFKCETISE